MEKAKPSKKKAYYKNRKAVEPAKTPNWRRFGKNDDSEEEEESSMFCKRQLIQPASRLTDLEEIWQETNVGQDFEILVNAPLSSEGHFAFKSEKNWVVDASKYDEFFSVDVKNLAMIIKCIPFNQYIEVDNKYFTKDDITNMNNIADKGKRIYEAYKKEMMFTHVQNEKAENDPADSNPIDDNDSPKGSGMNKPMQLDKAQSDLKFDAGNLDEDLDFLLSLKEPVRTHPVTIASSMKSGQEESKKKNVPATTKSIDLEKWLDMVLQD